MRSPNACSDERRSASRARDASLSTSMILIRSVSARPAMTWPLRAETPASVHDGDVK